MFRIAFAVTAMFIAPAHAQDAASVDYVVSFDNAAHHEAEITVSFNNIGEAPLDMAMSRSSPGRYALHEFAKNIYALKAVDGAGRDLAITQTTPSSWRVAGHDGHVRASYTLYADRADGTYSQIDRTHAHLNMPATFLWARGFEDRPVTVSFSPPHRNWKVASQLIPTRRAMMFRARDLQHFMDSPVELSNFDMRQWRIGEGDNRQRIRLAIHHDGDTSDVDAFAEKAKKIVAEQIKLFGEAPEFDDGVYTFIADYLSYVANDGMEHRNSTILTNPETLYEDDTSQLDALSHEFLHAWNVERLRPATLEPFDFTRTNPTSSLWFAEGFTSYYGPLMVHRAGEASLDDYLKSLTRLLNAVVHSPGRNNASPMAMSLRAPFVDAATAIDPTNFANTFTSYYPYGAVTALALDLTMRQRFSDLTLDDYMRYMWREYGKLETPYTHDDLRNGLTAITGDADFAKDFFAHYIEDGDLPDLAMLLAQAGLKLGPENAGQAWLGRASFEQKGDAFVITVNTLKGSPLYIAGLERGDDVRRIGRLKIDNQRDWKRALKRHKPGETTTIDYTGRNGDHHAEITFIEDQTLEVVAFEDTDIELSDAQDAFRGAWLGDSTKDAE